MKRQRRPKKTANASMFKGMQDFVIQKILILVAAAALILALLILARSYLYSSAYFKLRAVEVKSVFLDQKSTSSISSQLLNLYRDRNIFRLSLRGISESIRDAYPDAKDIIVGVALPDKLSVSLRFRKPVAIVRDSRLFAVDEEGVLLPSVDVKALGPLVTIDGISVRYDSKRAKPSSPKNLKLALELFENLEASGMTARYGVESIDAGKITNLSFYLKNGLEVKIGCENFKARIDILKDTLKDPRLIMDKIKYIDVRFEEVVIGPKE